MRRSTPKASRDPHLCTAEKPAVLSDNQALPTDTYDPARQMTELLANRGPPGTGDRISDADRDISDFWRALLIGKVPTDASQLVHDAFAVMCKSH